MPIYAFQCAECGHSFDRLQKMSDPDPDTCPDCGASAIKRQLTAPSFRLAGSGWYETDFKKDSDKKRNLVGNEGGGADSKADAKPASSTSDTASSGNAKSDSKPATPKAETKPSTPSKGSV